VSNSNQLLKPIETHYRGYRFRSRLEARWAVFFDRCGIEWTYEDQGFDLNGTPYLPDFWLPKWATFVEIKPDFLGLEKPLAMAKAGAEIMVLYGKPWPWEYGVWCNVQPGKTLIPFPTAQFYICLNCQRVGLKVLTPDGNLSIFTMYSSCKNCGEAAWVAPLPNGHWPGDGGCLQAAYAAARKARFEHGESG
jgi:hypothetical protein